MTYFLPLSLIAATALLMTSQTESARIVTIQRPLVITQERKTPAYFVFKQMQKLDQKTNEAEKLTNAAPSKFLNNLNLKQTQAQHTLSEMKFNKNQFLAPGWNDARKIATLENNSNEIEKISEKHFVNQTTTTEKTISEQAHNDFALKKWGIVRGKFELTDGVGVVDHIIELKRIEEGRIRDVGYVDLKAGLYSIEIESPHGYLMAQIKDKQGRLVGEDSERIINLQSRGLFFEGPFLKVGRPDGITINPNYPGGGRSAANVLLKPAEPQLQKSTPSNEPVSATIFNNEKSLDNADETTSNISKYSSTIARLFDPSRTYKNVTTIRHVGEKIETQMFTMNWVEGVMSYISEAQKIEFKNKNGPIILGRVLIDSKPAAGFDVQVISAPGLEPVYFDQFLIPSVAKFATTENGYFMFAGLEPGHYQVIVQKQGVLVAAQDFVAEEGSMSLQNINLSSTPKTKVIRSFDAFSSTPAGADAIFSELEEAIELPEGSGVYKSNLEFGIGETLVRPVERQFLPMRYTQSSRKDHIHLPLIQEQWLEAIKTARKITQNRNFGIIIGFTSELNYDAYLTLENYNKDDIVYFDSNGNIVYEPSIGGGFVLFNVLVGSQEVVLQEKNSDKLYSQVFNVHAEQISVTHFINDL